MEELEELKRIRQEDEEKITTQLLNQQIHGAANRLNRLQQLELDLTNEENEVNELIADLDEKNNELASHFEETQQLLNVPDENTGTFFDQLRRIEATFEDLHGRINGCKRVEARLRSKLNVTEAQIRKDQARMAELNKQYEELELERTRREADLKEKKDSLKDLDNQLQREFQACENLKAEAQELAKQKTERVRKTAEEGDFIERRIILQKELRKTQELLEKKRLEQKDVASRYAARQKIRERVVSRTQSPTRWMSERASLVAKVKKARELLEQMNFREASASRSREREERAFTFDDQEIMRALAAEIAEVNETVSPRFLIDTLNMEMRNNQRLEAKKAEFQKTSVEILDFQKQTMEFLTSQKAIVSREQRLSLLRNELRELRTCLSK